MVNSTCYCYRRSKYQLCSTTNSIGRTSTRSAVFRVTGHFSTPHENWTVRAFLQLTPRLSNDFTAAWLTFTFPQLSTIMLLWHSFLIIIIIIIMATMDKMLVEKLATFSRRLWHLISCFHFIGAWNCFTVWKKFAKYCNAAAWVPVL